MYELPATYGNLEFVIQKFPWLGPSISGPQGECTINCTSGANMVLCPPKSGQNWGARNRDQNRKRSKFSNLEIWECKTAAGSSLEGHRKSYVFFFQNGMRQSDLVSGPGRFSKALGFRSRLQWDSILPKTYWPIDLLESQKTTRVDSSVVIWPT